MGGRGPAPGRRATRLADGLVDTTVLVDLLRQHQPAIVWAKAASTWRLGVTPIVWMEVVVGTHDRQHQHLAIRLLSLFEMVKFAPIDGEWAMDRLARQHLRHGVGVFDVLIAASAYRLGVPLYTHNLKHFTPLHGELARKPY